MFLSRRTFCVPAKAVLILIAAMLICSQAAAAKAKAKVSASSYGLSKMSVPASMIKGSLLASGRTFYKSSLPESTLAGIRVGRSANVILAKWGNPTRITLGTAQAEVANVPAPSPAGPSYTPPGGGSMYGALTEGINSVASMYGVRSPGLPTLEGFGAPGMPSAPGMPGMPGPSQETKVLSQEEVTWTYDLQNGITLEYIITNGIITQITVGGEGPWSGSKTRTGIQLGDSYKLVLWVMGFPEEPQRMVGRFLRVSYVDKNRVLFTFLNKKVVGITIAMVPSELTTAR